MNEKPKLPQLGLRLLENKTKRDDNSVPELEKEAKKRSLDENANVREEQKTDSNTIEEKTTHTPPEVNDKGVEENLISLIPTEVKQNQNTGGDDQGNVDQEMEDAKERDPMIISPEKTPKRDEPKDQSPLKEKKNDFAANVMEIIPIAPALPAPQNNLEKSEDEEHIKSNLLQITPLRPENEHLTPLVNTNIRGITPLKPENEQLLKTYRPEITPIKPENEQQIKTYPPHITPIKPENEQQIKINLPSQASAQNQDTITNTNLNTNISTNTNTKPIEEQPSKTTSTTNMIQLTPIAPKKITFQQAKKEIEEFSLQMDKLEQEIKQKYKIDLGEFYYEEHLPDELKIKLIEDYFNQPEIIELAKKSDQIQAPK
jgi:hypothetical protein